MMCTSMPFCLTDYSNDILLYKLGTTLPDILNSQKFEIEISHSHIMTYQDWMGAWTKLGHPCHTQPLVPREACHIISPSSLSTVVLNSRDRPEKIWLPK